MSSGKPTKLSSSQNLTTWSSEAVWVLTLVHDATLDRDLYQEAEKQTLEVATFFIQLARYSQMIQNLRRVKFFSLYDKIYINMN